VLFKAQAAKDSKLSAQSTIDNIQWQWPAPSTAQVSIANHQSTINNQQSTINNQQSTIF
jgi:hypothetical protein